MAERSRIFIVGSGVVGTATGRGLADAGHRVSFVDTCPARVEQLRGWGLDARDRLDLDGEPDSVLFLTLPTPHQGDRYDLSAFTAGTAAVGDALRDATGQHTVVVRSTVPPGTTEGLVRSLLEERSGRKVGDGIALAANPEFPPVASIDDGFAHPRLTVIGSRDPGTLRRLTELLAPFGGEPRTFTDPAAAEFVKCAHHLLNATKISFWNEMWLVAQHLGLDLGPIAETVARVAEASIDPRYGIRGGAPFGGSGLTKDTRGFLGFAECIGVPMPVLSAVVAVNDRLVAMGAPEFDGRGAEALAGPSGAGA